MTRLRTLSLACSLALLVGCPASPPAQPPKLTPGPANATAKPKPGATSTPAGLASTRPATEPPRAIPQLGQTATLTGKVKLISDHGAGIISNNTGNVLSNNGGALISDRGGSVVANNGGGLISDKGAGFRLAQASGETLLADATIEVLDASGKLLTDEAGKPLSAVSGPDGSYKLSAVLPAEGLIVRVRLASGGALKGGELRALRARDAAGSLALDLDTAASLGASYVLDKYVQGRGAVLDKLPQAESVALSGVVQAALGALRPGYEPAAQVAAAEALRGQAPAVATQLGKIEAILLAGVANGGAGLPATRVSLIAPTSLALDGDERLLIAEGELSRIRRLRADGTLEVWAAARKAVVTAAFGRIAEIQRGADGFLWVASQDPHQLKRLGPTGQLELVAGNGNLEGEPALTGDLKALAVSLPTFAFAPGGGLVVGEAFKPRMATLDAAGFATPLAAPPEFPQDNGVVALAYATDGALWAISAPGRTSRVAAIARRSPAGAWQVLATDFLGTYDASLLALPDGGMLASEPLAHKVWRYAPDGTRTAFAGTGAPEHGGDEGPASAAGLSAPGAMVRAADGTLYVLEHGVGVVRAVAPDGTIATVAGAVGVVKEGDALTISLAAPAGLTTDPQGRIVIAEVASAAIKRLEGDKLVTIAGGVIGRSANDLPLAQSRFVFPAAVAYDAEGGLWITDPEASDVRRAGPDGIVRLMAGVTGDGGTGLPDGTDKPGPQLVLRDPSGVAIGPDGAAYVADKISHCVYRIAKDGTTRVVAGMPAEIANNMGADGGDGGPARAAQLSAPFGLAFRPGANPPELFVADTLNCRIRKIVDPGGANPTIETVIGQPLAMTIAALSAGGTPAEPVLALPLGVAFDAAGNLYVAEAGSELLSARAGAMQGVDLGGLFPVVPGRIRKVVLGAAGPTMTTVAGPGGKVLAGEDDLGVGLVAGMTFDKEGRLIIADTGTNTLKLIPAEALR